MGDAEFQSFDVAEVRKPDRMRRWNNFVSETFAVMRVQPEDVDDFSATLSRIRIGELGLVWYTTSASSGLVDVGRAGSWSSPHGDSFLLAVQEQGSLTGRYLDRHLHTDPGDMVLLDTSRPWKITSNEPIGATSIKLPAAILLGIVPDPEQLCGIPLRVAEPENALASAIILRIRAAIEADPLADWSAFEPVLLDTIGAALKRATRGQVPGAALGKLRRHACAFVERNLDDSSLSSGSIAIALGTSTRQIQRMFGEMGCTPRSYILERRLNVAAQLLQQPGERRLSITEIALSVGFGDLSHFDRCFRRRWQSSPRDFRLRHVAAAKPAAAMSAGAGSGGSSGK